MLRPTWVEIDSSRLLANLVQLKEWTGAGFFCPMVKANGYGHGALNVAQCAEQVGVSALGVALIEEAIELRENGVTAPILVFAPFDRWGAEEILKNKLTPVLGRTEDLAALESLKLTEPLGIHLKLNTGMQRMGFDGDQQAELAQRLQKSPLLEVQGVCSHLTHGEEADIEDSFTDRQTKSFIERAFMFSGVKHLHKSASLAVLKSKVAKSGLGSRPGIGVYGLAHEGHQKGEGLNAVMSWKSKLTHVHNVLAGESVGYGAGFTTRQKSVIGVIPVGYADGYKRLWGNRAQVLFRGQRVPVIGRVCMDYVLLDLTHSLGEGGAKAGEEIVLLGSQGQEDITVSQLAELGQTNSYEVVTSISERVPRKVLV